jgi:hypothetical protein
MPKRHIKAEQRKRLKVEAKRQHISVSQLKNQLITDGFSALALHPSLLLQDNVIVASDTMS